MLHLVLYGGTGVWKIGRLEKLVLSSVLPPTLVFIDDFNTRSLHPSIICK